MAGDGLGGQLPVEWLAAAGVGAVEQKPAGGKLMERGDGILIPNAQGLDQASLQPAVVKSREKVRAFTAMELRGVK